MQRGKGLIRVHHTIVILEQDDAQCNTGLTEYKSAQQWPRAALSSLAAAGEFPFSVITRPVETTGEIKKVRRTIPSQEQ